MTAIRSKKPKAASKRTKANGQPEHANDVANGAMPEQPQANGSATHHSNGTLPVALETQPRPQPDRDEHGRFLAGHSVGGRPLGSKNKLIEDFLADFHSAWQESGADALRRMVKDEPSAFVRAAVQLMPKDVLVEARGAGLLVVETPAAIKALLEALPDLGVLPLSGGSKVLAEADDATLPSG